MIEITFLGTSGAIPTISRNTSAIYLKFNEENILIDCGEGTQRQFRKAKVNPCKITRILLTHLHGDHIFGLPGLFQTLALNDYQKKLFIYGPKGTKTLIKEIFKTFIPHKRINYEVEEVSGTFLKTRDFEIKSLALSHETPTNGYIFHQKDKLRIHKDKIQKLNIKNHPDLKKLIQGKDIKINNKTLKSKDYTYLQKGKKVAFIFDTKVCANAKKLAENSDLAIFESTFLDNSGEGEILAKEYKLI